MNATGVTAGPAESNGKLLLGLWRDLLHVTCGLTACTPGSAPGPTLGNEYGKTFLPLPTKWRSYCDHRLCDVTSPCVFRCPAGLFIVSDCVLGMECCNCDRHEATENIEQQCCCDNGRSASTNCYLCAAESQQLTPTVHFGKVSKKH